MFIHPELSAQIARDRVRELHAKAGQQHLVSQARSVRSVTRQTGLATRRLSQALRAAARLAAHGQA
jgi:hypothetical protein